MKAWSFEFHEGYNIERDETSVAIVATKIGMHKVVAEVYGVPANAETIAQLLRKLADALDETR